MSTKNEAPGWHQGQKMRGQAQELDTDNLHNLAASVNPFGKILRRLAIWILKRHLEAQAHGTFDRRVSSALDCLETLREVER